VLVPRVLELLCKNGQEDVCVFVGGIIPEADMTILLEKGVKGVYGPGTPTAFIVSEIEKFVPGSRETPVRSG
jgi:methylmalonyl-CoA mutase cobalamin-binding domain/chain